MIMRCPWCGSPVIIQDNFWECGYCGDCGDLGPSKQEHAEKSNDFNTSSDSDFSKVWEELKNQLKAITENGYEDLLPDFRGVFWYTVTQAIATASVAGNDKRILRLRESVPPEHELFQFMDAARLEQGIRKKKVMGAAKGELTEHRCGTFWRKLIRVMPDNQMLDLMSDLLMSLSKIYDFLLGNEAEDNGYDMIDMYEIFEMHWENYWYS